MVDWYDVQQLSATGLKTVISSVFGNFADKREIQAALSENCPFYYSARDDIWIDYISDLGDGFNATYTMAHLMAQDQLSIQGKSLPRGKLLIMGGDQVYPTPEKEEYKNRLQGPYNAAFPWDNEDPDRPHLFALPGNHDWYDGLTNFLKLFCQGRALGNWHTQQKRSYFALQLPHRYWIWGIDVQLNADIDKPQQDYFAEIVKNEMENGDKIILCTAEPAWVYRSLHEKNESFNRLQFFINKHIYLKDEEESESKKKFRLLATITGDFHHYSHYEEQPTDGQAGSHLITAGGGGAFMHPTHMLQSTLHIEDTFKAELKETFPSKSASRKLAWLNLAFPVLNRTMAVFLGIFHLFTTWFLQSTTHTVEGENSFMEQLARIEFSFQNISEMLPVLGKALAHSPAVIFLNLLLLVGIFMFTDVKSGRGKWNYVAGGPHSMLQFMNLYFLIWLFSWLNLGILHMRLDSLWQVLLFSLEMIVIGGLLSGLIFGIYLLVSTLIFESHPTEAFSSFRGTGYKNFLRIHITKDEVCIYAIGVKRVVTNWKNIGTQEKPTYTGDEIQPTLIEKISIPVKN